MKYKKPLIEGILLKRYKRFLADVEVLGSGEQILAHVPNSGSMLGVRDPGSLCRISHSDSKTRKIPYTLEMVRPAHGSWVGVNTSLPNALVLEAFNKGLIKEWKKFKEAKCEVKINDKSRLDMMLSCGDTKHYVEVKNVSMAKPPMAVFPDAITERGQKHLQDLVKLAKKGHGAEVFFVVQREDCEVFRPCDEIDPVYGELLRWAVKEKVKARAWACKMGEDFIDLHRELEIDLRPPR
jgi:sugar fermentation stimulation protein A